MRSADSCALQLSLLSEPAAYHTTGSGYFAVLADIDGHKHQHSYRLSDMATVLRLVDRRRDAWVSQAEFTVPNRRTVNLARIGLLFADLDTYHIAALAGRPPEALCEALLYACGEHGLPPPSLVVFSGRGLQAKWLLEAPLERASLPAWTQCQRRLGALLRDLGADPRARDASRVLRLVDTVNTRSGEVIRVLWPAAGTPPVRYAFEHLAEYLAPEAVGAAMPATVAAERATLRTPTLRLLEGGRAETARGFAWRRLAWDRLEDLRLLTKLRGGVATGARMNTLFWQLNFMLLSGVVHASQVDREAAALAQEMDPTWRYAPAELATLQRKAARWSTGKGTRVGKRWYPALYTPTNASLIDVFEVTATEQRRLKTIIGPDEKRARNTARHAAKRRAAGVAERAVYEGTSASQTRPWVALGISRRTYYRHRVTIA